MIRSLVLIFFVPLILVWAGFAIISTKQIKQDTINEQKNITNAVNMSIEKILLEIQTDMVKISNNPEVKEILVVTNFTEYNSTLYNAFTDLDKLADQSFITLGESHNVAILNNDGDIYSRYMLSDTIENYITSKEFFSKILESKGKSLIDSSILDEDNNEFFMMAQPIIDFEKMKFLGIVATIYQTSIFDEILEQFDEDSDNILIVDSDYDVYIANESAKNQSVILKENKERLSKNFHSEINSHDGKIMIIQSDFNEFGLKTLNSISVLSIIQDIVQQQLIVVLIAGFIFILGIIFVVYVYNKLYSDISNVKDENKDVQYYELKQISNEIMSLISKKNTEEEKVIHLINRCDTINLDKLQAQINPHFLYNTLVSIKYIAILNDQHQISKLITELVKLLRSTINRDGNFIRVKDELENVLSYMFIQNTIYNENIKFTMDVKDEVKNLKMPNFLLQPLIENCIFHGIHPDTAGGEILVSGFIVDDMLIFEISDNGEGFDETFAQKLLSPGTNNSGLTNLGIKGVKEKIHLLYGDNFGIRVSSQKGKGSTVRINLPQENA